MKTRSLAVCLLLGMLLEGACTKKEATPVPTLTKPTSGAVPAQTSGESEPQAPVSNTAPSATAPSAESAPAQVNAQPNAEVIPTYPPLTTPEAIKSAIKAEDLRQERVMREREERRIDRVNRELREDALTTEGAKWSRIAEKRAAKIKAVRARRAAAAAAKLREKPETTPKK